MGSMGTQLCQVLNLSTLSVTGGNGLGHQSDWRSPAVSSSPRWALGYKDPQAPQALETVAQSSGGGRDAV